jgi:ATP/maltotriose-dependent transcriptional regulator MalT/DNA-binding SARP family transcriptional activator
LTEKLAANADAPVTLVAADAGSGKTTLIADFLRDSARPSVWYQLDHTDADPIVFLNYVAQGIRNIEPNFGEPLFTYFSEANEELIRHPERAADLLINEILRSIEQPFVLVLDDYHHIGADTIVHKIVDRIVQYSSEYLHLIITTRDLPPLAIMRRRTQSAALVITRDDLLFTDDEVRELFRQTLNVELKDKEITEYRSRTHGWITALQLVRQIAEKEIAGNGDSLDLADVLKRSEKDIFDYFAEEVFSREDEETQNLLMYLSLLESLPLQECSLVFPDLHCSAALPGLAQKNIFLTVAGDAGLSEEYRFHPLFRDFLRRRLRSEIGHAGIAAERNRIAEVFLASKQWELALPFLLDAENYARAAEAIAETGGAWIAAGAIVSLGQFADKVPVEFLEQYPLSLLHKAEIARLQGDTDASTSVLNRAVKLFHEQKDKMGEAEALHSLASLARRRGRPQDALKLLEKAEPLVPADSETYLKVLNTRGLCYVAQRNWTEAEQNFRVALELAEKLSNEHYIRLIAHNLALAPGFRGDFGEALRWFNRIFREDKPDKRLPQEAIGHLNVARLLLYRGELEKTETHLESALELAQLFDLRSLLPEVFETYANLYREKQDYMHAAEFYERSLNAYDEAGVDLATRELNEERAMFYLLRGDTSKARGLIEILIDAREKLNNEMIVNTAKLVLCRVDLEEGKTDGLALRVEKLLKLFHDENHYYDEALAAMLLAEVYFREGRTREMMAPLQRALDLSSRFDYEYWLKKEIRRNRGMFEHEDVLERLPPDLKEEVDAAATDAAAPQPRVMPIEISAPITDLSVIVFGPVDIHRDPSKPFAADAWTTRRARDIFCYIATRKHRRVAKDVLIDEFWRDDDPATIEKNFHPTISHIRKALNSRQPIKQNFIVFRDGAYQLNPERSYFIDAEEFAGFITAAEKAKREKDDVRLRENLDAAYALYRGDFMDGSYEDWAEQDRLHYREQFSRVLNGLAKLSVAEKRWTDALKFADEILAIDPYREDLHRLSMKVLAAQSKPAAVKKHYENMQALLKDELGIDPSAETRKLFKELMK